MTRAEILQRAADNRDAADIARGQRARASAMQRHRAVLGVQRQGAALLRALDRHALAAAWEADTRALIARRGAPTTPEVRAWAQRLDDLGQG